MVNMNVGFSLLLIAAGAILTWAVTVEVSGIDLRIVGIILLVVGIVGLVLTLLFWSSFAPFTRRPDVSVAPRHPDDRI